MSARGNGATEIVLTNKSGDELRVNLHPIALLNLVAELLEDSALHWCRARGHVERCAGDGHCSRCGTSLPDDCTWRSWSRDAYRSFTKADRVEVD